MTDIGKRDGGRVKEWIHGTTDGGGKMTLTEELAPEYLTESQRLGSLVVSVGRWKQCITKVQSIVVQIHVSLSEIIRLLYGLYISVVPELRFPKFDCSFWNLNIFVINA